jgi:Kdo2-lipid IVA lauroyltransferase/acyltransferase
MKARLEYGAFRVFMFFFAVLPRSWCLKLGRALGTLTYRCDRHHRNIALANLRQAFGREKGPVELRAIARDSFRRFGETVADLFKLFPWKPANIAALIDVEGGENLADAVALGKGVLLFSAHIGNWEIGSPVISKAGKFSVIARALDNPFLDRALLRFREGMGARVIYKQQAAKKVLQALRDREIVAILVDQNVLRREAVFVDFFGRPAGTTPALGAFHLRTGAPLLPVFCVPAAAGRYRLRILPPVAFVPGEDVGAAVLKITGICTKIIETAIREDPSSWLWVHDRWRSRPKDEHDHQNETA